MKQMKFLAIALTLLMSVAFTSCMDGGTDSKPGGRVIVEVIDGMTGTYFQMGEYKLYPTLTSLAAVESANGFKTSSTSMAYIMYEYDPELPDNANSETTKKLTINLLFAVSVDAPVNVTTEGASNDSVSTAPIIELSKSGISDTDNFVMVKDNYLLAGINYFLSGQKAHTFTMIYYEEAEIENPGELKLYLRHRSQEKEDFTGGSLSSIQAVGSVPSFYFYSFDLERAIWNYKRKSGGEEPKSITVEADVNSNGVKLTDSEKKTYTVTYKAEK